eukprot:364536-Chlamydomonas_euryale.AAC.15
MPRPHTPPTWRTCTCVGACEAVRLLLPQHHSVVHHEQVAGRREPPCARSLHTRGQAAAVHHLYRRGGRAAGETWDAHRARGHAAGAAARFGASGRKVSGWALLCGTPTATQILGAVMFKLCPPSLLSEPLPSAHTSTPSPVQVTVSPILGATTYILLPPLTSPSPQSTATLPHTHTLYS